MARIRRHPHAIAAALLGLAALAFAPALAQDQASKDATDLYDRPVLAIDPGMHTAIIWSQVVDAAGRFAVTGGDDRTVRIWSVGDGKLLRTIWIPVGPEKVGDVYAVAISPDGSTIAAGGWTERGHGHHPIYLFDRESGNLIGRIGANLPDVPHFLRFSPDGRYLAAVLGGSNGLGVFDRNKDWTETFRDDQYGDETYGAAFARDGRLATTSYDGLIRLYKYDPKSESPTFRRVGEPVKAPRGDRPRGVAFSPDGKRLAVGYYDVAAVDVLDGTTLKRIGGRSPNDIRPAPAGLTNVAWSDDGQTLFAAGGTYDTENRDLVFAWDRGAAGIERRMTYCATDSTAGLNVLREGRILVAALATCLGLMDARGEPIWSVASPVLDNRGQADALRVSQDGQVVDFGYWAGPVLRFDLRTLTLSSSSPDHGLTFAPNREGLMIGSWRNERSPSLNGRALPFINYDRARSLAIGPDAKRFFLGSSFALTAFDDAGAQKWR